MRTSAPKRECVVRVLQERRVLSLEQMMQHCHCGRMTVLKALRHAGYYSSYNANAAFYTLAHIPDFDEHGLWCCQAKRFSVHRTLTETLVQQVHRAAAGYAPSELEALLGVPCRHLLSQLAKQGRVGRQREGRHYVYLSLAPERQARQRQERFGPHEGTPEPARAWVPPGVDARSVIRTLALAIVDPEATPRRLAARLRAQGIAMTAGRVRQVFSHYELGEKKGS